MAGGVRISVLVSRDFQALLTVVRGLDDAVRKRLRQHTRAQALPIWLQEVRGRVQTRLQTRVLLDSARVDVSDQNITLRSATIGKTHGTPNSTLAAGAEFGANPDRKIATRTKDGTRYTRRLGSVFLPVRSRGWVVFPASGEAVRRVGALWVQTAYRTTAEELEKVS